MRKAEVVLRPEADADLYNIHRYIALEAGAARAEAYVERIASACMALSTFPERGTRRDDLEPGLRIVGFERRVTIAFRVDGSTVTIVRVFYGGRDFEALLRRED